ncbi:hypothetical protein MRB53_032909 [Persea americana]|uniref:Uncharacterized protein n=1 Tax=Persea americana TaxID=3435 RepID=A0ACC2KT87_PERAE|nr:hypothetical protein MRB53_032909 [Persea americana]
MSLTGKIPESMAQMKRLRFMALENNRLIAFYSKMGERFSVWNNPNLYFQRLDVGIQIKALSWHLIKFQVPFMDKDADFSVKIKEGFGPSGLGIISVSDVVECFFAFSLLIWLLFSLY